MKTKSTVYKMVASALCLALAIVLPFLTGQIPEIGSALCPMHIPVLLCGFICGGPWGALVGFIAPLLRSLLFSMPPMVPTAVCMAFELAAYGFLAGLFYKIFPKKIPFIYVSLILAMIGGRIVWGVARLIAAGAMKTSFPFSAFLAGAVTSAVPGIILHIVLIPLIVIALWKAKLIANE